MVSKLKTALVLVIIGAISGFLIWGTNELSKEGILENREIREQGYYKDIFGIDESEEINFLKDMFSDVEEVTLFDSSDNLLGYIYKMSDTNAYGDIVILVGIDTEGVITNVIISSSTNTPTYVKAVKDKNLINLTNQNVDNIEYDEVTSATFTYNSVKKVVDAAVEVFVNQHGGDE